MDVGSSNYCVWGGWEIGGFYVLVYCICLFWVCGSSYKVVEMVVLVVVEVLCLG